MKSAALSAVVAFALSVAAQTVDPSINTPIGVTQCQTSSLSFSGTHPPFLISVIPGGQAGAAAIEDIVTTPYSPYPWLCNLPSGSYITFEIRDALGSLQYSAPVSVANSTNSSCTSVTPSASTISATGVVSSTSLLSPTTSSPSGVSTGKPVSGSPITTASASLTTSKSSATTVHAQWKIAGVLGLLGLGVGVLA